jgi:hypothetical protein
MRVVKAGTAATAANMIGLVNPSDRSSVSRSGPADIGWMEIHFLFSPVPFRQGSAHKERPWVATLLQEMENNREGTARTEQSWLKSVVRRLFDPPAPSVAAAHFDVSTLNSLAQQILDSKNHTT